MPRDLYLRYTGKDGRSHVMQHRVWDLGLFVETRRAEQVKAGGKLDVITLAEYLREK